MRVCGAHQHPVRGQTRGLLRNILGPINQITRHHAGVYHANDQPGRAIIQRQGSGMESIRRFAGRFLEEPAIYEHRVIRRGDIHGHCPGAKVSRLTVDCKQQWPQPKPYLYLAAQLFDSPGLPWW